MRLSRRKENEQPKVELSEKSKEAAQKAPENKVLKYASFQDPGDLCNHINEMKIKPFSLNVTDRFYIVFYYENE